MLGSATSWGGYPAAWFSQQTRAVEGEPSGSLSSLNFSGCMCSFLCLVRRRQSEPEKTLTCWCPQAARSRNCELGCIFTGSW